jgi:hypothetical protein
LNGAVKPAGKVAPPTIEVDERTGEIHRCVALPEQERIL